MPHGDIRQVRDANLRLGAALAEVEGLYAALLRAGASGRRRMGSRRNWHMPLIVSPVWPPCRRQHDPRPLLCGARVGAAWRVLAERGAAWIIARYGDDAH